MDIPFWVFKLVLSWAARRAVVGRYRDRKRPSAGRFTKREADHFLHATWEKYHAISTKIPAEKTPGARMNVRLAALTFAFFQALLSESVPRDYAMELVADTAWKVYEKWAVLPILLTRNQPGKPSIEGYLRLFLRFPFNPPGYECRIWSDGDAVHTDFSRCPVALFLESMDAAELCLQTWCTLDYPLAEKWEGRYSRIHTLAAGDAVCDMVWKPR